MRPTSFSNPHPIRRRAFAWAAIAGLLAIMKACTLLSVRRESQTCDEAYNLFAGYEYLAAGRADESRQAFESARRLALTVHPESQTDWLPVIQSESAK